MRVFPSFQSLQPHPRFYILHWMALRLATISSIAAPNSSVGIWDETAPTISNFTKPGQRVKMTGRKLRSQCLSVPEKTVLVTCFKHTQLVGHAFATVWKFNGGVVGWVTQLVVDASIRKRYIATLLLQTLKIHPLFYDITAIGLVSSHPAACSALSKYANVKVNAIDTNFIGQHAREIFSVTPIEYLKNVKLRGNLFENCSSDVVSSVYTEFYVDHNEPLEALKAFKDSGGWSLGNLLDGHEFLIVLPVST